MAYEFELAMKELAVESLKRAHAAFLSDDRESYSERLMEAAAAIEGIGRLGLSADNPRFLWVDRLTCDWKLVDTMQAQSNPARLIGMYADCFYPPSPASLVLNSETPYLPESCTDVYAFYSPPPQEADAVGADLAKAMMLYSALTGGGGAGVDLLYKAGLALRRKNLPQARRLANEARAVAGPWLNKCVETLLRQLDEEDS